MMTKPSRILFHGLVVLLAAVALGAEPLPRKTVAVVRDGSSWHAGALEQRMRQCIAEIAAGRVEVCFAETGEHTGVGADIALSEAMDRAQADPGVDYVLVLGARGASLAAQPGRVLAKPVLGAALVDPDLVNLPIDKDGHSTKENYAVVMLASRTSEQLRQYRAAFPIGAVQLLFDERFAGPEADLEAWRRSCEEAVGAGVRLVPVAAEPEAALAALGAGTVMLLPTPRLSAEAHRRLLEGLVARGLPTLSYHGQQEVEAGLMAGLLPEATTQLARRVAVVFDQLSAGTRTREILLPVPLRPGMFLNEGAAARAGVSPRFDVLNQAILVGPSSTGASRDLTLADAVAMAVGRSLSLKARAAGTEASRQDVRAATGALMPQVAGVAGYQQIDLDRAKASGGLYPERTLTLGVGVSQTLFDDETLTRVRQARQALKAADAMERIQRLDTANAAAQAYLQFLSARAALRVTEQNSRTTWKHLELARLRQRVGTSGPEDIYRFEALSAQQRSEVVNARMQVERARTALNRALGADITADWSVRDLTLDDPAFAQLTCPVVELIANNAEFERLRAYLIAFVAANSPDVEAVDRGVSAQRELAGQKQRRPFLPKLTATAHVGRLVEQDYGGPTLVEQLRGAGLPVPQSDLDRTVWTVGAQATIPLFTGGSMRADTRKARAQLRQLELTRDDAREAVVAQTQGCLYALLGNHAAISLSLRAADLAERNLGVVQQKYEQGAVSIVTLLDAQTTAFAQRQAAEVAVYRFLGDVFRLQRLVGVMEPLATPEENAAWVNQARQAIGKQAHP